MPDIWLTRMCALGLVWVAISATIGIAVAGATGHESPPALNTIASAAVSGLTAALIFGRANGRPAYTAFQEEKKQ